MEIKMERLLEILKELKPEVDFNSEKALIDDEIFDSFDIVQLVGEISETFEIDVPPNEILPENFNSADLIWQMIQRLK